MGASTKRVRFNLEDANVRDVDTPASSSASAHSRKRRKVAVVREESSTAAVLAAVRHALSRERDGRAPALELSKLFHEALAATILPRIDAEIHINNGAPRDFAHALFQQSLRKVEDIVSKRTSPSTHDDSAGDTIAAAMRAACGRVPPHSVRASPLLKYDVDDGTIATAIRLGTWLSDPGGDSLMWWRRALDVTATSAACNVQTDRLPGSGEALVTDLIARSSRLQYLTEYAAGSTASSPSPEAGEEKTVDTERRRHLFRQLRTQMYCRYGLLGCVTMQTLSDLSARFREQFEQSLEAAIEKARLLESEAKAALTRARERTADLERAIRSEHDELVAARSQEQSLRDESQALYVSLANMETELMNRTKILLLQLQQSLEQKSVDDDTELEELQRELEKAQTQRDLLHDEATEEARPVCRMLDKLSWEGAAAAATGSASMCRQWALQQQERLTRITTTCQSSAALIATVANSVEELEAIVQNCEPFRALSTRHFVEEQGLLRVEEHRRERLQRVHVVTDYGPNMRRYLYWLDCYESMLTDPKWSVSCTDREVARVKTAAAERQKLTRNAPAAGGSSDAAMWLNRAHMRRMVLLAMPSRIGSSATAHDGENSIAATELLVGGGDVVPPKRRDTRGRSNNNSSTFAAARRACVVHSLVSDLDAERCRVLPSAVFREILARGRIDDTATANTAPASDNDDAVLNVVSRRVFRWPLGMDELEKRGLAFAMLVAVCPEDGLIAAAP